MMKRIVIAFAAALAVAAVFAPVEASARHRGGVHHGHARMHHGHHAMHRHWRPHRAHWHRVGPRQHFGGHRGWRHGHLGPRYYGWHGPRRMAVGGYARPYPLYARPRFGYAPACTVRRHADWRKVVIVRTCYRR